MAHIIMQAPDGLYFIWSTIVDDVIYYNATERDLLDYYKEDYGKRGLEQTKQIIESLKLNEKPYGSYTMTFEEAMEIRKLNKSEEELNQDREYCKWIEKQLDILSKSEQ